MGVCMSAPDNNEVTERDRKLHREAEKQLKEVCPRPVAVISGWLSHTYLLHLLQFLQAKARMASQVKVTLTTKSLIISLIVLQGATPRIRRLWEVDGSESA